MMNLNGKRYRLFRKINNNMLKERKIIKCGPDYCPYNVNEN